MSLQAASSLVDYGELQRPHLKDGAAYRPQGISHCCVVDNRQLSSGWPGPD